MYSMNTCLSLSLPCSFSIHCFSLRRMSKFPLISIIHPLPSRLVLSLASHHFQLAPAKSTGTVPFMADLPLRHLLRFECSPDSHHFHSVYLAAVIPVECDLGIGFRPVKLVLGNRDQF